MMRYVAVITVVMCGFAVGIFGAYRIDPAVAVVPYPDAEPSFATGTYRGQVTLGTIREIDYATGLLTLDAYDPFDAGQSRLLLISIESDTAVSTPGGQPLAAGNHVNVQVAPRDDTMRATTITRAILPI